MIEWLLGHKVNDVDSAYYKFDVKSALGEYRKHMGALLIEKHGVKAGVEKRRIRELAFELKEKEERILTRLCLVIHISPWLFQAPQYITFYHY